MAVFLVKLGGGLITVKSKEGRLDRRGLATSVREVAAAWRKLGGHRGGRTALGIVVTGAGSFGHPQVRRHRLHENGPRDHRQREGIPAVQASVATLHAAVLEEFHECRLPVLSLPPRAWAANDRGQLAAADLTPFEFALTEGLIPLTFGDLVPDLSWTASVLSGDTIMELLAEHFHPPRAVFALEKPGVFLWDPAFRAKTPAPLVEAMAPGFRPIAPPAGSRRRGGVAVADVTRSIVGKLDSVDVIAKYGVPVLLVSGRVPGRLRAAILGKKVVGTLCPPETR